MRTIERSSTGREENRNWRGNSLWLAITALLFISAPADAQIPAKLPGEDNGWLQWGVAIGLAVVICISGFINSKRSHLH